jgi:hypothetical protein
MTIAPKAIVIPEGLKGLSGILCRKAQRKRPSGRFYY